MDVVVKQNMSGSKDSFDSMQPRDIIIFAEDILKSLKENPTPQTTELVKKFLRDVQKCDDVRFLHLLSNDQHREDCSATCSSEEPFDKNQRWIGEKLVVFRSKEIGQGTDGTVVYEGSYEGRPVAVKRLLQNHIKLADQEIQNLIATDHGPNIVRYHGVERDKDFVYLALERCDCSFDDLIKIYSAESFDQYEFVSNEIHCSTGSVTVYVEDRLENLKNILGDVTLHKEIYGRPSPLLLKLMRDMVSGLVHLHGLRMVHRDLKPQNVLITKGSSTLCAKISDMGISKRLAENKSSLSNHLTGCAATGWKAPEQLLHGRQTSAMDLFSLGCILFYVITRGRHPFGDHERDENIKRKKKPHLSRIENFPEASHLISLLLKADPEERPKANEVFHHPLFWDAETRLNFLHDSSDCASKNTKLRQKLKSIEGTVFGTISWKNQINQEVFTLMSQHANYNDSLRDLLRLIRNMLNHYYDKGLEDIQYLVGPLYEGFDDYFTSKFPKLCFEVYKVVCKCCKEEKFLKKYLEGDQ